MQDVSLPQSDPMLFVGSNVQASHPKRTESTMHVRLYSGSRDAVEAFNELIRPYERSVYLLAFAIAGNTEMAEKIASEAVYRVYAALEHDRQAHELRLWFLETAVSVGRDLIGLADDGAGSPPAIPASAAIQVSDLNLNDGAVRESLMQSLQALPQFQRIVIVLRDCLHLTILEISSLLGLPRADVTETLSRARFAVYRSISEWSLHPQRAFLCGHA